MVEFKFREFVETTRKIFTSDFLVEPVGNSVINLYYKNGTLEPKYIGMISLCKNFPYIITGRDSNFRAERLARVFGEKLGIDLKVEVEF